MNTLALLLHGGLMPVSENVIKMVDLKDSSFDTDSRHQLMEDTNFWWLGDWIPFFTPIGSNSVLSPGDLIVGIGLIVFIVRNSARRGPYSE